MTNEIENIFSLHLYLYHNIYNPQDYTRKVKNPYIKRDRKLLAQSHSNENIYRTAQRAPIPLQDTIIPLMAEEVITMEIDASKQNCKLKFKAGQKKLYYIKKVIQKDFLDKDPDERLTYFFASLSPHFTSSGDQAIDRRYIDQIGNSVAVKGEVMFVDVNWEESIVSMK